MKLSRLNLDFIPNKIHKFDNGVVKVISASLVLVRRKLSSETIASVGRREPMVYCSIELVSGVWEAKIKISYVSVILLLYPLFFFGIISFNFISVLKFHPLSFVLLLIPFGVVSFLYSIIEAEAVDQMYKIFAEFSEIVS
ncbi:hypothetical protein EHQ52_15345 [Leptospira koniambonensis]|uniref:Uncharacterized protein n=1 Tax=Leptospira koniambonensis TaxID=2484950 RepID=A0A4R9J3I3_9LEPT|nr:hypothetical protein [Leptospira koniambonensis]TGL31311.1 hypothetical protein EHQ52_15345 [Leptospira koniambonensis]